MGTTPRTTPRRAGVPAARGGFGGESGFTIASYGDDLHVVGPTAPVIDGFYGCVVVKPDGFRYLAHLVPDPLAE